MYKIPSDSTLKFNISEPDPNWRHPGGKLLEKGASKLSDSELLAIIISTGIKGKPAEKIAKEILTKFNSYRGLANQPLHRVIEMKGMGEVKAVRIAATFEIARRIVNQVLEENEKE